MVLTVGSSLILQVTGIERPCTRVVKICTTSTSHEITLTQKLHKIGMILIYNLSYTGHLFLLYKFNWTIMHFLVMFQVKDITNKKIHEKQI